MLRLLLLQALLALLDRSELDTLLLRQADSDVLAVADDEDIVDTATTQKVIRARGGGENSLPSGEDVASLVTEVDDLEGARVLLTRDNLTDTADVSTTDDHGRLADLRH